mgnify:CR=1 FL=1
MNNNTFNFSRFGKYYVSDLKNTFNNTWLTVLLTSLSGLIAYLFCGTIHLLFNGEWDSYGLVGRSISFFILLYVLIIIVPSKAYGFFTDKRRGSFFTLIPASSLEKFLAMFINTAILAPLAYLAIALSADTLLCLIDPNCGETLVSAGARGTQAFNDLCDIAEEEAEFRIFSSGELFWGVAINTISWTLIFLLGALYFKKNKIGKTILVMILISMATSIITTPLTIHFGEGFINWLSDMDDPQRMLNSIKAASYSLSIIVTVALGVWAYIRVRTVKH